MKITSFLLIITAFRCLSKPIFAQMYITANEAHVLADKMSQSWINFAKTGNPNHAGLPKWETHNATKGATMFFGNTCEIKYHYDADLLELVK